MPAAVRPENDEARVAAVRDHLVPEDGRDDGLQAIAEAAAKTVGVPVALVSLVDAEHQFFGACCGLAVDGTPREQAFCAYTILDSRLLEVPDARRDPRFSDNALVTGEPNIVFYAGAPLTSGSGYRLGTLCLIDFYPRILSQTQRAQLQDLANAAERVLRNLNRLKSLNTSLDDALTRAKEAERTKSVFLASMSHELRTPLNAVIGFAQLVEQRFQAIGDDRHAGYARDICDSGGHLLSLINDILDVSRLEQGRYDLSPELFDVAEQMAWVRRMATPRSEQAGVTVDIRVERGAERVVYDLRAFRQILLNLVGNAVKYGHPGGAVNLSAAPVADGIRVHVTDDGPGIDPAVQNELFRPFARAVDNATKSREGSGLGLYLSKKLAELAGGWIRLITAPGAGTTVAVEMPSVGDAVIGDGACKLDGRV